MDLDKTKCSKAYTDVQNNPNDEHYTMYDTVAHHIENILQDNPQAFSGKTIYFPCDDFDLSQFPKYFMNNQNILGWKKLICTCYQKSNIFNISYGKCVIAEDNKISKSNLRGSGDFRSLEVRKYFEGCDIVITNPPFSLSRFLYQICFDLNKQFSIIGMNADVSQGNDLLKSISDCHVRIDASKILRFFNGEKSNYSIGGSSPFWYSSLLSEDKVVEFDYQTMSENILSNSDFNALSSKYGWGGSTQLQMMDTYMFQIILQYQLIMMT